MEPCYKIVVPRKEVRQGRSFNPDEFAIHLEQVIGRIAPKDCREPDKFFNRRISSLTHSPTDPSSGEQWIPEISMLSIG